MQTLPEALQDAIGELWAVLRQMPRMSSTELIAHPIYGHVMRAHTQLIRLANRLDDTTKPLPALGGGGEEDDENKHTWPA